MILSKLRPIATSAPTANEPPSEGSQAPLAAKHMKSNSPTDNVMHTTPSIDSPSQIMNPISTTSPQLPSVSVASSASGTPSNLLVSHKPPTAAAFAIPLSIVAFILTIATILSFRHCRKLKRERIKGLEKLSLSRESSKSSYKSTGDIESTLAVLSKNEGGYFAPVPVPLFMPVDLPRVPERSRRRIYTTPSARNSVKSARPLSTRSVYSQSSAYLPPIVPTSRSLFDEYDNLATDSIVENYLQPSPPLSPLIPSPSPRVHALNDPMERSLSSLEIIYGDK